ncbi:hypothetical protein H0274_14890 [Altererythrobacter sp. CC-YST694]|uniref:hypothetical protein n=1 Tax=Altererythrobacter sp. CC-YST694 TaxID=2755038 RepID=UPI001D01DCC7|nr:hypothetical protein [Altererythrobacter sp. CC-YST694]MCB5426547.1 hypothetical protein [Altererythrobacter sp. CC-YST694]
MGEHSAVVAEGMKRVCSAFTTIVHPLGFKRGNGRVWVRQHGETEERIYISRSGNSYGAPRTPSIDLQLGLASRRGIDDPVHLDHHTTGKLRRPTGYCYHHRFNAQTGSTYDRCLEELALFTSEVAEPWFAEQR